MFRALLWKEWRQLALVRWGGLALGLVLPVAFFAGAELSERGLLPTGAIKSYSSRDLMYELLPAALALGVWPLVALMSTAQAFAGDRAAGTENFLVERPVSRPIVWSARAAASLGGSLSVIAGTGAIGASIAALTSPPPDLGWTRWLILGGIGVGVAVLGWIGGMLAATVLGSPIAAVLAGGVLGAVPVVLAASLSAFFHHARYGPVVLGLVVPWLLLPAYVAASYTGAARGEPAGGGRARRAGVLAAGGLALVGAVFLAAAVPTMRANARTGITSVLPTPDGRAAVLQSMSFDGGGGWIVDVASGRRQAFLNPPVEFAAWSPDGGTLAVGTRSAPLGAESRVPRLEMRDRAGRPVSEPVGAPPGTLLRDFVWSGDDLVAVLYDVTSSELEEEVSIYRTRARRWEATGYRASGASVWLSGPLTDGRVFLREIRLEKSPTEGAEPNREFKLLPVDVKNARVGAPIASLPGVNAWYSGWSGPLSPSGRYAVTAAHAADSQRPGVFDLTAGGNVPGLFTAPWGWQWLAGDRLAWVETQDRRTRLMVAQVGRAPLAVREWRDAQVGIRTSPDGRALFVSVISNPSREPRPGPVAEAAPAADEVPTPVGKVPEESVYRPDDGRTTELNPPFSGRPNDLRHTEWAGPKTLARIAPGVVYLEDIDAPGKRRFVIGGEADLR